MRNLQFLALGYRRFLATEGSAVRHLHVAPDYAVNGARPGLYGLPNLFNPGHWQALATETAIRCTSLLQTALTSSKPTEVVQAIDDVSDAICQVHDSAEFCRNTHSDPEWRQAAEEACIMLQGTINELNTNTSLYTALHRAVARDRLRREQMGPTAYNRALSHADPPQGAGPLRQGATDAAQGIADDVRASTTRFRDDVVSDHPWAVHTNTAAQLQHDHPADTLLPLKAPLREQQQQQHPKLDETHPGGAPMLHTCMYASGMAQESADGLLCEEGRRVAHGLLRDFEKNGIHLPERQREDVMQLTEAALRIGMQICHNINDPEALGQLPTSRNDSSGAWSSTWAHAQHGSVPATMENCASLLSSAHDESQREAVYRHMENTPRENLGLMQQLIDIRRARARLLGEDSYAACELAGYSLAGTPQAAEEFLKQQLKLLQPQVDAQVRHLQEAKAALHPRGESTVRVWDKWYLQWLEKNKALDFSIAQVQRYFALEGVLQGLIELLQRLMNLRVRDMPFHDGESWAARLRKWAVYDDEEGELQGYIYLDLHARAGKGVGAAHYTLRSRRKLSQGSGKEQNTAGSCSYQLPLVALTLNLSGQLLLSLHEVQTLYHEFGHALHSLLSRTKYQHMSGTRGPVDLIEVPSHWFERFALHPQCLTRFARHVTTGEAMPHDLVQRVCKANDMFDALSTQHQAVLALVDLYLHGNKVLPSGGVAAAVQDIFAEHSTLAPPSDCFPHLRVSHLVSYGGNYYSYRFAEALGEGIWRQFHMTGDLLHKHAGTHVRKYLLQPGGAKNPAQYVIDLLGKSALQAVGGGFAPEILPSTAA